MNDYFDRVEAQLTRLTEAGPAPRLRWAPRRLPSLLAMCGSAVAVAAVAATLLLAARPASRVQRPAGGGAPQAAGGRCPVTRPAFRPALAGGLAFGRGPVYMLVENRVSPSGVVVLGRGDAPGWSEIAEIWAAAPAYNGSITVRARRLDGHGPTREGSDSALPSRPAVLSIAAGAAAGRVGGWRANPGGLWVRGPGCFGIQVHGHGFEETIVVRAVSPARRPTR